MWAAYCGHTDCVRLLIDAGANKEARNHVRIGRCLRVSSIRLSSFLPISFMFSTGLSFSPFLFIGIRWLSILSFVDWPVRVHVAFLLFIFFHIFTFYIHHIAFGMSNLSANIFYFFTFGASFDLFQCLSSFFDSSPLISWTFFLNFVAFFLYLAIFFVDSFSLSLSISLSLSLYLCLSLSLFLFFLFSLSLSLSLPLFLLYLFICVCCSLPFSCRTKTRRWLLLLIGVARSVCGCLSMPGPIRMPRIMCESAGALVIFNSFNHYFCFIYVISSFRPSSIWNCIMMSRTASQCLLYHPLAPSSIVCSLCQRVTHNTYFPLLTLNLFCAPFLLVAKSIVVDIFKRNANCEGWRLSLCAAANPTRRTDFRRWFVPVFGVKRAAYGCWLMPAPTRRPGTMCVIGRCFAEAPSRFFLWLLVLHPSSNQNVLLLPLHAFFACIDSFHI